MGRVILCETTPSASSFIFPNTKIEVFSYEELCYYLYNNIALIEEDYLGVPMFNWIENELDLPELAGRLREIKDKEYTGLTELVTEILTFREYYTLREVKEFILQMERMKGLSPARFRKLQADGFLRYHKYLKAVAIYDEILEDYPEEEGDRLLGSLYHNKAVALANYFEWEAATESYLKAYELTGNPGSIYEYLLLMATRTVKEELVEIARRYGVESMVDTIYDAIEDAEADVAGSPVYHRMEKAIFHFRKNNLTDFSKRMDAVIEELKTEFREQIV